MIPSGVAGQSDSSDQLPEFDPLFFQDNFFHAPPEGLLGDHSVPQSHDLLQDMDMDMHTFLQIPEEPSTFTTSLQPTSDSSSDSDPVEPLINSIDSKETTSVTPTSSSLDGETRLGKRKRAENGVEDEREAGSTSLLPDDIPVCKWRKCGVTFRSLSELRKHVRSHTVHALCCRWSGCERPPELRGTLNKHLDTHIKPHFCPERGCLHTAATSRDIQRHMRTHQSLPGYHCPIDGCKYSQAGNKPPFSRIDNATRHIKRRHVDSSTKPVLNLTNAL